MGISNRILGKRDEIVKIARSYGASNIRIFGSAARGEETEASDVDFLVEMKEGTTLLDIISIKQDLEDLLGCNVDVVTEASLSPYIKQYALKEAVNL